MSRYHDLSEEDKVKLIGGFVAAGTALAGGIIFIQLVLDRSQIDRLWASGASFFNVAKTVLPSFYLYVCLPPSISAPVTAAYLRRRFSDLAIGGLLLLVSGAALLFAYLLLSLFDLLFAGFSVAMQAPFVALALIIPGILLALIIKTRKVDGYIRKVFG